MKKRLLIPLVIVMMIVTLVPATVRAQETEPYGGLTISGVEGTDWAYKENSADEHELRIKKNNLAVSGLYKGAPKLNIIVENGVTELHLAGLKPMQTRKITLKTDVYQYNDIVFTLSLSGENEITKMYLLESGSLSALDQIIFVGKEPNSSSSLLTKKNISAKETMQILNLKFTMAPDSQDGARLDAKGIRIDKSIVNAPGEINYYEKADIITSEVTTQRIVDRDADGGGKGTLEARWSRFIAEDGSPSLIQGKDLFFLDGSQVENFVDIQAAGKVEISGGKVALKECISGLGRKEPYPDVEIENGELTAGWLEGKNITFSGTSNVSVDRPDGMPAVGATGTLSFNLARGGKVEGKTKEADMLAFLAIRGITFAANNKIVLPQDGEIIDVPLSDKLSGKGIGKGGDFASHAVVQYQEDETPIDPDSSSGETPTGDDTNILPFAGLALVALVGAVILLITTGRKRK